MTELAFIVAGIIARNDFFALLLVCSVLLTIGACMMAIDSERVTRWRRARELAKRNARAARRRAKAEAKYWAKRGVQVAYREPFFAYRRNNKMRFVSIGRLRINWVMTKRRAPSEPMAINGNDYAPSWQAWR